jgi:hypothetical protein
MIGIAGMRALWMLKLLKQSLIANDGGTGRQLDIFAPDPAASPQHPIYLKVNVA